eukprot:gene4967-6946_t
MTKTSRRRTLSHTEIESFLTEITATTTTATPALNNNFDNSLNDSNRDSSSESLDDVNRMASNGNKISDEQYIRDFCKLRFGQNHLTASSESLTSKLCDIGLHILQNTNYKILPSRLLLPNQFIHPHESLEAKKSLLISLTPMLSDAENQRNRDVQLCEEFTRCKSGKGKGRYSCYEYTDIDSQIVIPYEDYESRYMIFIMRNKIRYTTNNNKIIKEIKPVAKKSTTRSANDLKDPLLLDNHYKDNGGNNENLNNNMVTCHEHESLEKDKSSKNKRSRATSQLNKTTVTQQPRRITLSPATAKSIISAGILEEDSTSSSLAALNNEEADLLLSLGKELDGILANNDSEAMEPEDNSSSTDNILLMSPPMKSYGLTDSSLSISVSPVSLSSSTHDISLSSSPNSLMLPIPPTNPITSNGKSPNASASVMAIRPPSGSPNEQMGGPFVSSRRRITILSPSQLSYLESPQNIVNSPNVDMSRKALFSPKTSHTSPLNTIQIGILHATRMIDHDLEGSEEAKSVSPGVVNDVLDNADICGIESISVVPSSEFNDNLSSKTQDVESIVISPVKQYPNDLSYSKQAPSSATKPSPFVKKLLQTLASSSDPIADKENDIDEIKILNNINLNSKNMICEDNIEITNDVDKLHMKSSVQGLSRMKLLSTKSNRDKAHERFLARIEIAQWKFIWELVSVDAANAAIAKINSKMIFE